MNKEEIVLIISGRGKDKKLTWFPEILKSAEKKMPGIPEATIDKYCKINGMEKEEVKAKFEQKYGIKTMDYRSSLEYEFNSMEKQPRKQFVKNAASRYPYYSFFTKDQFFLPMSKKIWEGDDMVGDPHWERFVQLFNEAMNVGNISFKAPPGRDNGVHYDKGEVEWESDDVLMLVLAEMRHFRDTPQIPNEDWELWHHMRDDFVQQEMARRGYKTTTDFIEEEEK